MKAPPKYVLNILCALDSAGHRAVLAGGCVRDSLLGRRPSDWDIASSASPEATLTTTVATSSPSSSMRMPTKLLCKSWVVSSISSRLSCTPMRSTVP